MIVGRNRAFRLSATLCCYGLATGVVSAPSLIRTRFCTNSIGAMAQANFRGMPAGS
jgi:hypothetical protein